MSNVTITCHDNGRVEGEMGVVGVACDALVVSLGDLRIIMTPARLRLLVRLIEAELSGR